MTLTKSEIVHIVDDLKAKNNVRIYTPYKYFQGLTTQKQVVSRFHDMLKKQYKPFQTDAIKSTKKSKYTIAFEKNFGPDHKTLSSKSEATGVPLDIIQEVFRKGQAAWRTGHRVGATENQWGYARVHSFLTLGCTAFASDFYLLEKAVKQMSTTQLKKFFQQPILCPSKTLQSAFYKKRGAKEIIEKWKQLYAS
jgi:hypothetical protein